LAFTYGLDDETPTWAKGSNLELKWREDDACRSAGDESRETADKAWRRLYNAELPDKDTAIESVDQGDCMLWLFEGGRVFEQAFDSDAIYELSESLAILESNDAVQIYAQQAELDDEFRRTVSEAPAAALQDSPYSVDGRSLSADQSKAIETTLKAIEDGQRVLVITGAAGTGKTTMARALANKLEELGWIIEYMAPTGKAAVRISEVVKKKASTIHARLFSRVKNTEDGIPIFLDPQQLAHGRKAFICDEGSMVGSRLHKQILNNLGPHAILIYLADPFQLPPVADTWGPNLMNPTAQLTQVHRQADESPVLHVATLLRNGESMPKHDIGTGYLRRQGSLEFAAKWMVEQQQAGEDAIVLCYSNKTRQKVNSLVRHLMGYKRRGPLCLEEQLVVLRNNKFVGRMNGETMVAEKIRWLHTPKEGIVVVESGESRFFTMPNLIGAERTAFEYHSRMGDKVGADSRGWLHLDYAYCLTVHKSQGSEYQKVLFIIDNTVRYMWSQGKLDDAFKLFYTAVTRAKEQLIVLDAK